MCFEHHICLSIKTDDLAFPILVCMSSSLPASFPTKLSRYVNMSASSSRFMAWFVLWLIFITLVFDLLVRNPAEAAIAAKLGDFFLHLYL